MRAIYKIRNVANGHFYVGGTVDTRVRFQTHRRQLRAKTHHCEPLQRAWEKYGEDFFKFEVVEIVHAEDDVLVAENRWLSENHGKPHCYNVSICAYAPMRGLRHSDKTRTAMAVTHKGRKYRLGQTNSPEHRAKISAAMKGKKKSPEHAEKIRQRMLGTAYSKGRKMSEEEKARRSRRVIEVASGAEFASVRAAADHYRIERPNLIRALRSDQPIKRGINTGLHFRYALPPSPE